MDLRFTESEERFRQQARQWIEGNLSGEYTKLRGRGGAGDEEAFIDERMAWERKMGTEGWTCLGWPKEYGGRGLTLIEHVIFNEEYARAGGPGRLSHIGEGLLGPTIIAFGTEAQKQRFLPPIVRGEEIWCQGYSEPNAGSDLANVQTRAVLVDGQWELHGQKVWTSWAQWSDWCFVLCRTDTTAARHKGISYLLVPMKQPGIEIRPIRQITGGAEFNEVFFDSAKTAAENVVGGVNNGWKVAMGTLAFERGASTLSQQLAFEIELKELVEVARRNGRAADPIVRDRLAQAWIGLRIMRLNALRMLTNAERTELSPAAMISKLYWSNWHRDLGELAMDILGPEGLIKDAYGEFTALQRLYLFSRSETIYAGSNEIQRNIIAERALGLPR